MVLDAQAKKERTSVYCAYGAYGSMGDKSERLSVKHMSKCIRRRLNNQNAYVDAMGFYSKAIEVYIS